MSTWRGIEWPGDHVAILASGQSLTPQQCEAVKRWREAADCRRVIVINTTYRLAPWADVLYGCDEPWWFQHIDQVRLSFQGERWTQDEKARLRHGINWIQSEPALGLGKKPGVIHQGMNGGYQAINLAYQAGATKLLLFGYDMHGTHWHGKHPLPLTNTTEPMFKLYRERFARLAKDLADEKVEVVNCSPGTKLEAFPKVDWTEALA